MNRAFSVDMPDQKASCAGDGVRNEIERRLLELEDEIAETIKRLPAHSTKPPVMIDLLALEDERDELLNRLSRIEK